MWLLERIVDSIYQNGIKNSENTEDFIGWRISNVFGCFREFSGNQWGDHLPKVCLRSGSRDRAISIRSAVFHRLRVWRAREPFSSMLACCTRLTRLFATHDINELRIVRWNVVIRFLTINETKKVEWDIGVRISSREGEKITRINQRKVRAGEMEFRLVGVLITVLATSRNLYAEHIDLGNVIFANVVSVSTIFSTFRNSKNIRLFVESPEKILFFCYLHSGSCTK